MQEFSVGDEAKEFCWAPRGDAPNDIPVSAKFHFHNKGQYDVDILVNGTPVYTVPAREQAFLVLCAAIQEPASVFQMRLSKPANGDVSKVSVS